MTHEASKTTTTENTKHIHCYCGHMGLVETCDFCSGLREHCGDVSCDHCNKEE